MKHERVALAALGAVAAYFAGRAQAEAFEGEPKEWVVEAHEKWGTAAAASLVVWAVLDVWKGARRHIVWWGLVAAALLAVAGFYGGIVAHGH